MHFRFRGNSIQIIKSQPDPVTGKAKSVPLGSINRETFAISDKLRSSCSAAEIEEIESWVNRYQAIDLLKRRHAVLTLPEQLAAAADWFETADADEARQIVDDVITGMAYVRKILNRRGLL